MKNIWVPLSGAIAQQRKVEIIANNVANANTNGFKKDGITFKEYMTALDKGVEDIDLPSKEWKPEDFYRSYGAENSQVEIAGTYTNFEQGQLTPTNNPLDFALQGDGFFEILTPNGIKYTREGSFTLATDGTLVTSKGYPLLLAGTNAEATPESRTVKITGGVPVVTKQGDLFIKEQNLGKLSVVAFKDIHALRKEGNNSFSNPYPENALVSNSFVHQGFIEQSNVNAVEEMTNLIQANRHFESIQRAMKAYDNIAGKGVNEITKF